MKANIRRLQSIVQQLATSAETAGASFKLEDREVEVASEVCIVAGLLATTPTSSEALSIGTSGAATGPTSARTDATPTLRFDLPVSTKLGDRSFTFTPLGTYDEAACDEARQLMVTSSGLIETPGAIANLCKVADAISAQMPILLEVRANIL